MLRASYVESSMSELVIDMAYTPIQQMYTCENTNTIYIHHRISAYTRYHSRSRSYLDLAHIIQLAAAILCHRIRGTRCTCALVLRMPSPLLSDPSPLSQSSMNSQYIDLQATSGGRLTPPLSTCRTLALILDECRPPPPPATTTAFELGREITFR